MIRREFWQGDYGTESRRERLRVESALRGKNFQRGPRDNPQYWTDTLKDGRQALLNAWRRT